MKRIKTLSIMAMLLVVFISGCKKEDATYTYPEGTTSDPLANATGVVRNKQLTFIFKEAMDPTTINASTFTLIHGTVAVPGTVTYTGTTATFAPSTMLEAGTPYTATITTGAKNLSGQALTDNIAWSFTTAGSTTHLAVVNIGSAGNYVMLAKTAISNNATSAITGDLGLSPAATSYITGFSLTNATGYAVATQVTGKLYAADMAAPTPITLTTAINDMGTGYNDAAGRPSPDFIELATGDIGGKTLPSGLYKWTGNVTVPANVTLSGGADDVWIFQIAGNLTTSAAVNVILKDGAQAKNIFWQVAGVVTLGTTSHFEGIVLSQTSIILKTGASIKGRALAQTSVILDKNTVTMP
ncbi:MAG TPA: hypothetical protein DCL77_04540 [Prolixibacteraceae bacterium]|nr:hypothetical protein [Prolixibacteraceae bacterium]